MAYPDDIYVQRALENLPGLEYDALNKKTLFAEDILNIGHEVTAIETYITNMPKKSVVILTFAAVESTRATDWDDGDWSRVVFNTDWCDDITGIYYAGFVQQGDPGSHTISTRLITDSGVPIVGSEIEHTGGQWSGGYFSSPNLLDQIPTGNVIFRTQRKTTAGGRCITDKMTVRVEIGNG